MALLEQIACELTSIAAPIDNVEDTINELSNVNPKTRITGFQQQFEVYKSHYALLCSFNFLQNLARSSLKEQDFTYKTARSLRNQDKNRFQELLPRKEHKLLY